MLNRNAKFTACKNFMNSLNELLRDNYTLIGSCNRDESLYLVPKGTEEDVTYYGKPALSFRLSDHWSWYSNLKKCSCGWLVQCHSIDVPWPRKRTAPADATKPRIAMQVAICDKKGLYHCVYGEVFDRKTKTWSWVKNSPEEIVKKYGLI